MSFIYCATTDAAVHGNPWEGMPIDRNFFYDLVLQNLLLGNRLLLNADDIFRHPVLRAELVENAKSLARVLVQLGQICVLGELSDPPAVFHIHAKKIAATQALVRNNHAQIARPSEALINSEFGRLIQQLPAQNLAANGFFVGAIPERDFTLIVSSFLRQAPQAAGGRELFQHLVDQLYGQTQGPWQSAGKGKLLQLMADIYACATARVLAAQLGEPVGVDTQWAAALGWAMPFRALMMAPLSGPVSLLKLPWPNSLLLPKLVQKLLDDGEVSATRRAFIMAWRQLQTAEIRVGLVDTLRKTAAEFNRELHQLAAKSGTKDTMANPANLILSFEPTSFQGAPVLGEIYWQQAFSGARRMMALWNFTGAQTGPVDAHTLPSYQLIYSQKKLASVLL